MRITRKKSTAVEELCATFARRCRERGVRVTAQRLAVYRALAGDPNHPTADAIYRRLRTVMPSLSPGTVYRVLESLVVDGLLQQVSTTGGPGRFDANVAPHQHLICRVCGRMTDVHVAAPALPTADVGRAAARAWPRFVVEDVDVRIVGRCATCPPGPAAARRAAPTPTPTARPGRGRRDKEFDA